MSCLEHLPADVPVPILYKNLPIDSKITDIDETDDGKQICVSAITPSGIIHCGYLNIPDKYYVEIFHPENENVVVLFWYDERNIIFIDNYDICEQSLRVSSG